MRINHNVALVKLTGVQTLCYRRGIYEVARAKVADDVLVQVFDLQLHLLLWEQTAAGSEITGIQRVAALWVKIPYGCQGSEHNDQSALS